MYPRSPPFASDINFPTPTLFHTALVSMPPPPPGRITFFPPRLVPPINSFQTLLNLTFSTVCNNSFSSYHHRALLFFHVSCLCTFFTPSKPHRTSKNPRPTVGEGTAFQLKCRRFMSPISLTVSQATPFLLCAQIFSSAVPLQAHFLKSKLFSLIFCSLRYYVVWPGLSETISPPLPLFLFCLQLVVSLTSGLSRSSHLIPRLHS